jgi:hypothetical protein
MHFECLVVVFSDRLGQARRRVFPVGVILIYMYKSYRSSVQSARCIRSGSVGSHTAKGEHVGLVGCRGDLSQGKRKEIAG